MAKLVSVCHFCYPTGEDGREVLKIILAANQSAGEGRKITWPYTPTAYGKPIDLWKPELRQTR